VNIVKVAFSIRRYRARFCNGKLDRDIQGI
jgi:hypothetical protein